MFEYTAKNLISVGVEEYVNVPAPSPCSTVCPSTQVGVKVSDVAAPPLSTAE
jgi:hypothetical protein